MNLDRSGLSADEYYLTAMQIFDYCGAESTGKLRVDALMEKFAPFVKTNKAEYTYLKSLLDPEEDNPEISVSMLAKTLHKYSDQKSKVDLDESFNLKSGQMLGDSDSGISTDGSQLVEELQRELREKSHAAAQLRARLDYCDRQHDDALAALVAERDTLRAHLNLLREENLSLSHVRRDYEEACERLGSTERVLDEASRELDTLRRRNKLLAEQLNTLETEKVTLQELLSKSKAECHRINEMYAARQCSLLEQNELLRTEHADLSARLHDHDEFVQQIIKEKVLMEMELKDLLNKSNQTQLRLDRSIDVSYTEEQMLTALDTLNSDSRFSQENRILDEESFINALREDQGRSTNMSLFDEIRLSFCNLSRLNTTDNNAICDTNLDNSFITVATQTDSYNFNDKVQNTIQTQTEDANNNHNSTCLHCENINRYTKKLERDVDRSHNTITAMQTEIERYEENLNTLEKFLEDGNDRNDLLRDIIKSLEGKIGVLEVACEKQRNRLDSMAADCVACTQTECDQMSVSTQAEVPCVECVNRNAVARKRGIQRFFWESIKWLFQLFAVLCFVCALCVLYSVTRSGSCARAAVPWRWLHAHELLDLLLRIEYVADVPM